MTQFHEYEPAGPEYRGLITGILSFLKYEITQLIHPALVNEIFQYPLASGFSHSG